MGRIRRLSICADDFGFSTAACRSILALGESGRISATSVAVDGRATFSHCRSLALLRPGLAIGLHLNLTENPGSPVARPLRRWILDTYIGARVPAALLRQEVRRQLDLFEELFGAPPDYIDGHEHVHQFPCVREQVLDALLHRYGRCVAARSTQSRVFRGAKAAIIEVLGGAAFTRRLDEYAISRNQDFAGVYDLRSTDGYGLRMRRWLGGLADGGLVMCHPEEGEQAGAARAHEHAWFASAAWPAMVAELGVELVPFRPQDRDPAPLP